MKKTKIMGAALSAVVVGLLAVGCDSALLDNGTTDKFTPGVTEEDVNVQMFDPGKEISLWYGEVLNEAKDFKASAIMKMEPLPAGASDVIDGYIEFAIIKDYKDGKTPTKNTAWLGSYKIKGATANTLQMNLDWGGDKGYPGMEMFGLTLKPAEKAAVVSGKQSAKTEEFQFTMRPAAVGSKTLNVEELTKGFARATGADEKNYVLSLDTEGNFQWFGKINEFSLPNNGGKYKIADNGEITLTVNYNGQDVIINRVAGETISDEGHGSVAVEKCLWIAFDSADLEKVGYNKEQDLSKKFSNLPILFSLASNPVTK